MAGTSTRGRLLGSAIAGVIFKSEIISLSCDA